MSVNVLVVEPPEGRYAHQLREAFATLTVHSTQAADNSVLPLSDVDVLIAFGIDDRLLRQARRLTWIQALGTGVDHFLRCPALRTETLLTSTRGIHGAAMQETVAFLMLALNRDAPRLFNHQAAHIWDRSRSWPLLRGRSVAIVGLGVIGAAVGQILKSFGMTVVGVSRTPRRLEDFDRVVSRNALRQVAADTDYLVGILPSNDENRNVIGHDVFAAMKPSSFVINVGRGDTMDEAALISALQGHRIAGAALDVFAEEPLPTDSPFWDLPNVILLPHIAGLFSEYEDAAMRIILANMRLFLGGRHAEMLNRVPH